MSRAATLRRHALQAAVALLLVQATVARAADDKPPPPPTTVTAAQQQYARWVAAFGIWRGATSASPSETPREAALRKTARLLVVPTPTPLLGTQRRLDGHAIVVSLGLVALLDELLLAEAMPADCFNAYAQDVTAILSDNRAAARAYAQALNQATTQAKDAHGKPVRALPAEPLKAWPRFGARVEAGKAQGQCAAVKPAALRSAATRAWVENNADSLALWLLARQAAVLAADPTIETPPPKAAATPASASASGSAPSPSTSPAPLPAKAACLAEIDAAARAAGPMPPPEQRARLALCTTDRPPLQTLQWLQDHLGLVSDGE